MSRRVLHLVGTGVDHGGVLSVIRNLAVAEASAGGRYAHAVWVNREFRQEREPALETRTTRMDPLGNALREVPKGVRDLGALLKAERFDILHAHDRFALFAGVLAARRLGRPLVSTIHFYARRPWIYRGIARLPWVHTCLLTPNMARHYGIASGAPRVHFVPDCCSDTFFGVPLGSLRTRFSPEEPLRLRGFGMLIEWKGWHVLLDAIAGLPERYRERLAVEIIGKPSARPEGAAYAEHLKSMVAHSGLQERVKFSGFVTDVRHSLMEADWFVLPSVNEPCSVALSEALAFGKPVLVTRSGGNVDTVREGGSGFLFPPGDAAALGGLLRRILDGERPALSPGEIRESARERSAAFALAAQHRVYDSVPPVMVGMDNR